MTDVTHLSRFARADNPDGVRPRPCGRRLSPPSIFSCAPPVASAAMNWLRRRGEGDGEPPAGGGGGGHQPPPPPLPPGPDEAELRRRRLARFNTPAPAAPVAAGADTSVEPSPAKKPKSPEKRPAAAAAAAATATPAAPAAAAVVAPKKEKDLKPAPSLGQLETSLLVRVFGISLVAGKAGYNAALVSELRDAGAVGVPALTLSAEAHADMVLVHQLQEADDKLGFLTSAYARGDAALRDAGRTRTASEADTTALQKAATYTLSLVMSYAGLVLAEPESFAAERTPEALADMLLRDAVPSGFIRALVDRFASSGDEDDRATLQSVFSRVFSSLVVAVGRSSLMRSDFLAPLHALSSLVGTYRPLAEVLTQMDAFAPDQGVVNGMHLERATVLGPFFALTAMREDPLVAEEYFTKSSERSKTDLDSAIVSLRESIRVLRSGLYEVCMALCKAGPAPREALLKWFALAMTHNSRRTAIHFDRRVVSGDGFILNVMDVLLRIAEPFSHPSSAKLAKVDPTYVQSSHRIDYSDETRLAADSNMLNRFWVDPRNRNAQESLERALAEQRMEIEEAGAASAAAAVSSADVSADGAGAQGAVGADGEAAVEDNRPAESVSKEFGFVSEIFFLTLRAVQLGFVSAHEMYTETILKQLGRTQGEKRELEASAAAASNPTEYQEQLTELTERIDALMTYKLSYDVYLRDEEALASLLRFVTADAAWLVRILSEPPRKELLPLPLPPLRTFVSLPEATLEILNKVLLFTTRYAPGLIESTCETLDVVVTLAVATATSPGYVKNPYLRAKLLEFINDIMPRFASEDTEEEERRRGRFIGNNPAIEAMFATHVVARQYLPSALFRLYVDVEHTGSHNQFFDKFSIRWHLTQVVECMWHLPDYRASVRTEALSARRFIQFVNMLLNDANFLLGEIISDLTELRQIQRAMERREEWEALSVEDRREKEKKLHDLESQVKSYIDLGNASINMMLFMTEDSAVRSVFVLPEMVSRVAEMLNFFLSQLTGPKCAELSVRDREKYGWEPRRLLKQIVGTYLHFADDQAFVAAVAHDGRSFSDQLFRNALRVLARRGLLPAAEISRFAALGVAAQEVVDADAALGEDLGEVPDDFQDPLVYDLMKDPVILPTSGMVMDRANIVRHLLSDRTDPFNRKMLTEDMLKPAVEIKTRIDAWLAEKRAAAVARRRAAAMELLDTPATEEADMEVSPAAAAGGSGPAGGGSDA